MNKEWIHISAVLEDMETILKDGKRYTFSFSFVRNNPSKNGPRGSIKHVRLAAKFTRPERKSDNPTIPWQFKDHDAIPIQDLENDVFLTPKYTHIIEYNGKPVKHYG